MADSEKKSQMTDSETKKVICSEFKALQAFHYLECHFYVRDIMNVTRSSWM